ncbi:hypothetical protein, partial [Pseudomonas avellanae]|uniref:hypothetical protein n=1 Tax=Pseudomonas avellanae TaxID=46257 RepID=UPI001ED9C082
MAFVPGQTRKPIRWAVIGTSDTYCRKSQALKQGSIWNIQVMSRVAQHALFCCKKASPCDADR